MRVRLYNKRVQFAHVGSVGTYRMLSSLSDFDMFLAPLMLRDSEYAEFCTRQSQKRYTILDSGALELYIGTENLEISEEDILDISIALHVSEVVCPDAPGDPKGSLIRTKEFISKWHQVCSYIRPKLMVVPHGRTYEEWFANAEILILQAGDCTVGVPRLLAQTCKCTRPDFRVTIAQRLKEIYPHISIHFLGAASQFPLELRFLCHNKIVRSMDSTFIYRYASSGINPEEEYAPPLSLSSHHSSFEFCERALRLKSQIDKALARTQ